MQAAVIAVLLGLLLIGMRPTKWNGKYLDKATTSTINGLFIWLVFMSHFTQYLPEGTRNLAGSWLGQLVVVMFLFYSGYGCVVQWQAKGDGYLAEFPKKRMWPTIVNFDIAVAVFVVAGLLIGKTFTVKQMVLSMVCWESVGNSNWYIFAILVCYGIFWLAAGVIGRKVNEICGGGRKWTVTLLVLLGMAVAALSRVRPSWWYDTMMAFGAGAIYGAYRAKIEDELKRKWVYWAVLAMAAGAFWMAGKAEGLGRAYWLVHNTRSVAFAALVVMVTMKVEVKSAALRWSGEHLFPIYIYQRVPMMVFQALHPAAFEDWRCWIYCGISAGIAGGVAAVYPKFRFPFGRGRRGRSG